MLGTKRGKLGFCDFLDEFLDKRDFLGTLTLFRGEFSGGQVHRGPAVLQREFPTMPQEWNGERWDLGIPGLGNARIGDLGSLTEALQTESAWNLLKLLLLYTGSPFRKSAWRDPTIPKKKPQGRSWDPPGNAGKSQGFLSIQPTPNSRH